MKKVSIVLMAICLLLTVGCSGVNYTYPTPLPSVLPPVASPPSVEPPIQTTPVPTEPAPNVVLPNEPPADRTWISPGKISINNYYPGGRAEYPISIHNGKDTVCSFAVTYRSPDRVAEGYSNPAPEAKDWILIADTTPILMPRETREVLVVLAMPQDVVVADKNWEFWISVKDTTQKGMIQTELCVRWLVSMR